MVVVVGTTTQSQTGAGGVSYSPSGLVTLATLNYCDPNDEKKYENALRDVIIGAALLAAFPPAEGAAAIAAYAGYGFGVANDLARLRLQPTDACANSLWTNGSGVSKTGY